jgi:hypothetical protein
MTKTRNAIPSIKGITIPFRNEIKVAMYVCRFI